MPTGYISVALIFSDNYQSEEVTRLEHNNVVIIDPRTMTMTDIAINILDTSI